MMLATLAVWSLHIAQLHTIPPPPSCSQLVQPFAARGVSPQHIPTTPLSGIFQICNYKCVQLKCLVQVISHPQLLNANAELFTSPRRREVIFFPLESLISN